MSNQTYHGYANYETWACALWIDNHEHTQDAVAQLVRGANEDATATEYRTLAQARKYDVARALQCFVRDEMLPDLGASFASDLLGSAYDKIDFDELAEEYLNAVAEGV